jgi:hypothetical protein
VYDLPAQRLASQHTPTADCPIPQTYIDCILDGCLQYGPLFAQEFLQSTRGWKREAFVNDRDASLKKYPGKHKRRIDARVIDRLMEEFVEYDDAL